MDILIRSQLLWILVYIRRVLLQDLVDSYCLNEKFRATCGQDHIIVITAAYFGRMRIGKCVKQNYGHVGCKVNVIDIMDTYCSGKNSCEFSLFGSALQNRNNDCPEDMKSYLEATYECIPVLPTVGPKCEAHWTEENQGSSAGYISSQSARHSPQSTLFCSWTLSAKQGQHFRVSLLNFARYDENFQPQTSCLELADLYDGDVTEDAVHRVRVCNGGDRSQHIWQSQDSTINVRISTTTIRNIGEYLIKFEVAGCADLPPASGMNMKRTGDNLEVKCNNSRQAWNLVCKDNQWLGELGTCLPQGGNEKWTNNDGQEKFPYGVLIIVAAGVALGVFLGGILLGLASMHMKRRQRRRIYRQQQEYQKNWTLSRDPYSTVTCPECASVDQEARLAAASGSGTFPRGMCDSQFDYKDYVTYKSNMKTRQDEEQPSSPHVTRSNNPWSKRQACDASGCL